ncbi:hypothetical protein ACUIJQ_01245 [Levilactobacillus hammesii]|uniref:Uncharacterized protein n=1 Tax=Levilactobacillus hammesii DSM 16381 TaxID=1423753 RepID=A0A0R1ULV4_9LACO|nr:hypothetical protein [Levilactobacillus hammesii]KRL94255.1 hypothetical protein FD28_GL000400 [Levilactobacillus hammesii DSM 16381]
MANTKNSQAAKIRQQIISWLQDDQTSEVVSEDKFPGIRGIRAVKLRAMLGKLGYVQSVVMGAVSAAPSIDPRIKKAAVKPREVYYYFDADMPAPAKVQRQAQRAAATSTTTAKPTTRPVQIKTTGLTGLSGTPAFKQLLAANAQLTGAVDELLTAAQEQRPLTDLELNFLTEFATKLAQQTESLQNFTTQSRIDRLRRL